MTTDRRISARLNAALEGCYEVARASALSGVPQSTVYLWARNGLVTPSGSLTRVKLWSYADLMALRIVHWLRHSKSKSGGEVPANLITRVREVLVELNERGLDLWDDSDDNLSSPFRVDISGKIWLDVEGVSIHDGQVAPPGSLDLLGSFDCAERRGPNLIRPRPDLRIVPGRLSGEPHLANSRITTLSAAALYRNLGDIDAVAELYPGIDVEAFEDAVQFELSLAV